MSQNFQALIKETNNINSLQQNKQMNSSMASSQLFIIFATLAIFAPLVLAKEYAVGDSAGWNVEVDYEAWTKGKKFSVGDTLVFKYTQGSHNVIEVKEDEYTQCEPSPTAKTLSSGQDIVKLDAPGKRYFICGVGKHCQLGKQKIAIDVGSSSSSSADPTSGPSASSPDASTTSESTKGASSPTESGSSDSAATKSGSHGSSESKPSAVAPAPDPSKSATTIGNGYGWMVIMSGIVGFLLA